MKPKQKCQNLQFFKWPLEAGSKRESISIQPHVKMHKFTTEINMFTAWYTVVLVCMAVEFCVISKISVSLSLVAPKCG